MALENTICIAFILLFKILIFSYKCTFIQNQFTFYEYILEWEGWP